MRISKQNPDAIAAPVGRYSHVARVESGDAVWLYVSGQLALDEDGELIGRGDLGAQTERIFENLRAILAANGATFDDVVKVDSYLTTFDGLDAMRDVRARYTPAEPPASTLVRVVALVMPDALIEVDLVAVVPAERHTA